MKKQDKPNQTFCLSGSGSYLPEFVLTNEMLSQQVETDDQWIQSRTGISQRRLTGGEPTWFMAVAAARQALSMSGVAPHQIDAIIVSTCTPDYYFPATACIVQAELGADRAFCLDVNMACTGFIAALDLASRYLADPAIKHVLVIAAEAISKVTDYNDRTTCVLFGDGAGAVVCSAGGKGQSGLLSTVLGAEGQNGHTLVSRALPVNHPFVRPEDLMPDRYGEGPGHFLEMDGQEVFKFAVRVLADAVLEAVKKAGLILSDLKLIVPHQANRRIVEAAAKRLGLPASKMFANLAEYGNTSSASIPICLDQLIRQGQLVQGDTFAICGFGAGLTYGAAILTL